MTGHGSYRYSSLLALCYHCSMKLYHRKTHEETGGATDLDQEMATEVGMTYRSSRSKII